MSGKSVDRVRLNTIFDDPRSEQREATTMPCSADRGGVGRYGSHRLWYCCRADLLALRTVVVGASGERVLVDAGEEAQLFPDTRVIVGDPENLSDVERPVPKS